MPLSAAWCGSVPEHPVPEHPVEISPTNASRQNFANGSRAGAEALVRPRTSPARRRPKPTLFPRAPPPWVDPRGGSERPQSPGADLLDMVSIRESDATHHPAQGFRGEMTAYPGWASLDL